MGQTLVISYADITREGGIPTVLRRLAADIRVYGSGRVGCLLHDLRHYHRLEDDGSLMPAEEPSGTDRPVHLTVPWAPPQKIIPHLLRCRARGVVNAVWPWGMFCHQQGRAHWNGGRAGLFAKRAYLGLMRRACLRLADGFLMQSAEEAEFSGIGLSKCALVTMGRPPSPILDALESGLADLRAEDFANDALTYIGRGQFIEKGIAKIVALASSERGRSLSFRFFCSSPDEATRRHVAERAGANESWDFETSGAALVPHLRRSRAYLTVSDNPIQLRTPYEALCLGTPVVTQREAMMEGMRRSLAVDGLGEAVAIVDPNDFASGAVELPELAPERRVALAEAARKMLHPREFVRWLEAWCMEPRFPADFYAAG